VNNYLPNRRAALQASLSVALGSSMLAPWVKASETDAAGELAWPSWRGPTRDGICPNKAWPSDLAKLEKIWSVDLSDSYSGPIVASGVVFTTETVEERDETLIAIDLKSGQELWKRQWPGAMSVPFFAKSNGDWIRSTPATDGKHIIVGGMRDVLACFDCASGEELWRIDFAEKFGTPLPSFGLVCSPLIDGEFVYVQAGGGIRKLRMADGGVEWVAREDGGGMNGGAFSSPVIATIAGVRQLVAQTRNALAGIDLKSGKPLWSREIASFRGMNILTPTVWKDSIFTSSYGGKSQLIRCSLESGEWSTDLVWEGKAEAYMSSPILVADHLYLHLKNNRVCCIDLSSGKETWRTTPFGKYWSMITNGERILALDENGELLLVDCNINEFTLLDRKQVSSEPSWAHLAIDNDIILVRRQHGLDAYRWS
jgi:outer membrane protein assembly factor BamB